MGTLYVNELRFQSVLAVYLASGLFDHGLFIFLPNISPATKAGILKGDVGVVTIFNSSDQLKLTESCVIHGFLALIRNMAKGVSP